MLGLLKNITCLFGLLFFTLLFIPSNKAEAAFFTLSSEKNLISQSENFAVNVSINTEEKDIILGETILSFDSDVIKIVKVVNGGFFPNFFHHTNNGRLYLGGFANNIADEAKNGEGLFATIYFYGLSKGKTQLRFICEKSTLKDTNIISKTDQTDLADCDNLAPFSLRVADQKSISPTEQRLSETVDLDKSSLQSPEKQLYSWTIFAAIFVILGLLLYFIIKR